MPNTNTIIQFKRSALTKTELQDEPLQFGEPLFFEQEENNKKNRYLAIGNGNNVEDGTYPGATFFEGITDPTYLGKTVYSDDNNVAVTNDGTVVNASAIKATKSTFDTTGAAKYYLLTAVDGEGKVFYHADDNSRGIYVTANGVLTGGAWNDYAERRTCVSDAVPGNIVCEDGNGNLVLSTERLQPVPYVVSDTYGMLLGTVDGVPVAVAGRALVFVDCNVNIGDVLCAGENGKATVMTRQEVTCYPDRILGIVSEIPKYDEWNGVTVGDRVWITLK